MPLDFELGIMDSSITLFGLLILLVADLIRLITERLASNCAGIPKSGKKKSSSDNWLS